MSGEKTVPTLTATRKVTLIKSDGTPIDENNRLPVEIVADLVVVGDVEIGIEEGSDL